MVFFSIGHLPHGHRTLAALPCWDRDEVATSSRSIRSRSRRVGVCALRSIFLA